MPLPSDNTMQRPLFIFAKAPLNDSVAREGIEALLACAAFDMQPAVLFTDEGVLQLLPQREATGTKNLNKMLQALELYGVEAIYVCANSLTRFGLTASNINISGHVIELHEHPGIIQNAAWVASF